MYELKGNFGELILDDLSRHTFEKRLFSYEIKLEYVENNEHDSFYYDPTNDEPDYQIKKEYIYFINEFLDMLDGHYSEEEKINYFNTNYNPPYKNMKNAKLNII